MQKTNPKHETGSGCGWNHPDTMRPYPWGHGDCSEVAGMIEKLGITPIRVGYYESIDGTHERCIEDISAVKRLESQRNELLEVLLRRIQTDYIYVQCGEIDFRDIEGDVKVIEKATGLTWEEVKEKINV